MLAWSRHYGRPRGYCHRDAIPCHADQDDSGRLVYEPLQDQASQCLVRCV